jgi:large subunit ribosomal protein L25
MSNDVILKATKREIIGKKLAQLREAGNTPAVVHDHGKESIHITVPQTELRRVYHAAGKHGAINLTVDDKKYVAMIKDVAYKPATQIITHTVFQAVKANETVKAEVPIKLSEDIPAEKASLLVLRSLDHIEVEAKPADLVDEIEVDASSLEKDGDKLYVSDIKAPEGVEIKTDPETVIASVETPRDQIAEADAAAAELAADAGTTPEAETAEEEETEASEEE